MDIMQDHYDSAPGGSRTKGVGMVGFDDEFTDIVDYILRITYRIWEGKQIGLCYDYYSDDCPVYTMAGITIGAEEVTQNTLITLASFPDRTLGAENIIWGGNDTDGFHTSHLIKTSMTNLGSSDMGPATGNQATFFVIAHCVVKDNKIIEEWLVRDNYALTEQLGFDVHEVAAQKASEPSQKRLEDWYQSELNRVSSRVNHERQAFSGCSSKDPEEFINLSKDQRYKDVLEDLKSRMKRRQVEVGDPFHDAKIVKLWLLQEEEGRTSNYKAKKQWRWKYLDHFPSE